jgi:ribosomal protein S18 acetylase RimI-like enzyme
MTNVEITPVTLNEIDQLIQIGRQTFQETFSESNSETNMKNYLEQGFSSEKMTSEINNLYSAFYFATLNEKVIGYLKINLDQSQTEIKDKEALEIERIYVLKEFQGKNVGQLLYDFAYHIAKEQNVNYIWLGVWEKNPRAINFYKKNGFIEFDKHIFMLGEDEQIDCMMKLEII